MPEKTKFTSWVGTDSLEFKFSANFCISRAFYFVKTDVQSCKNVGWDVEKTFSNTYKNTTFCSIKNVAQIPGKNAEGQYLWKDSMFVLQSKKIFGVFILS